MRAFLILLLFCLLSTTAFPSASGAQGELTPLRIAVHYDFAQRIRFEVQVDASLNLQNPRVWFQVEGQPFTEQVTMQNLGNGRLIAEYTRLEMIPPFAYLVFWIEVEQGSRILLSPRYRFRYLDNRFPWQMRQEGAIRLFWSEGDTRFAQTLLDAALRGVQGIESQLGLSLDAPLELYVYPSGAELQNAVPYGGFGWESGHASPKLGVALVAITPGPNQSLVAERLIPHEMLHILLYRRLGKGYDSLPLWLREGLAKMVELSPDADAERVVRQAIAKGTSISFRDLCQTFPSEAGAAYLSYAQSLLFVRYLLETYGKSALNELLRTYADGIGCEQGVVKVYGKSLSTLEYEWRVTLGGGILWQGVFRNLASYLLLLLILLGYPLIPLFRRKQ